MHHPVAAAMTAGFTVEHLTSAVLIIVRDSGIITVDAFDQILIIHQREIFRFNLAIGKIPMFDIDNLANQIRN